MNIYDQIVTETGVDQEQLYRLLTEHLNRILFKIFKKRCPDCRLDFEDTIHSYYISLAGEGDTLFKGLCHIRSKSVFLSYLIAGYDKFIVWTFIRKEKSRHKSEIRYCDAYLSEDEPVDKEAYIKSFAYCYASFMDSLDTRKKVLLTRWLINKCRGRNTGETVGFNSTYRVNVFCVKRKFLTQARTLVQRQEDLSQQQKALYDDITESFDKIDSILLDQLNRI